MTQAEASGSFGRDVPRVLLVNPWICDFAAYDFWAKPLGLLSLAAFLKKSGLAVSYIDCLDRFHPRASKTDPSARNGRGPYLKTPIPSPRGLEDVPRTYSRYGVLPEWLREDLLNTPRPDLILVTSLMTYWHSGVAETIFAIRQIFPNTPVVLGGIYATLCPEHARRTSGADEVFTGPGEEDIFNLVERHTGFSPDRRFDSKNPDDWPHPALELQRKIHYAPILTARGCPFSCAYCASGFLTPRHIRRSAESVLDEIALRHKNQDVLDFALYDDAFLVNSENHAAPILEEIIRSGYRLRFHTPNALHIREITPSTAKLMFDAGFESIRLGLETTAFDDRNNLDTKVCAEEFIRAVHSLKAAGFERNRIGAYLLVGLPGQDMDTVSASISMVRQSGITPIPAYYTPIPHTALWEEAVKSSRYDLEADPVFSNNAILPCRKEGFSWKVISRLKSLCS